MTWSVPSTKAIFIVPSGTSSTASRSTRRATPTTPRRAPRGSVRRLDAGRPLVLEELAQVVPGAVERHPCDHRLQEAEDDELAGLVRRDAAALEVEQLGRVDRADRRRVRSPATVGLVDLERRDGNGSGGLRQVHPELAKERVGPDGGLLDRDQALHEASRSIEQGALREQIAGRVAADVARVRRQIEELLLAAEHDLDLFDRAAIALETVVDPGADEPAAELGERPVQ